MSSLPRPTSFIVTAVVFTTRFDFAVCYQRLTTSLLSCSRHHPPSLPFSRRATTALIVIVVVFTPRFDHIALQATPTVITVVLTTLFDFAVTASACHHYFVVADSVSRRLLHLASTALSSLPSVSRRLLHSASTNIVADTRVTTLSSRCTSPAHQQHFACHRGSLTDDTS